MLSWNDGVNRAKCIDRRSCASFIIFFLLPPPDDQILALSPIHISSSTRVPLDPCSFFSFFSFRSLPGQFLLRVEIDSYGNLDLEGESKERGTLGTILERLAVSREYSKKFKRKFISRKNSLTPYFNPDS